MIINNIENIDILKQHFEINKRVKIFNFFENNGVELLYKNIILENNWILATGINKNKYEKSAISQFNKINSLQIKNVNNAFGNDQFSYNFYRSMNGVKMSYIEFNIRQILNSKEFIDILNNITGLGLTKLTTLFLSKYKSGSFLSPHSDKGNGRLAYVINLTKNWKPQYGGILHFMNENRTEIIDSYVPIFNSLYIFYVPEDKGIPHYVSHVCPNVKYNRYSITGWFD
jgi:Rps23 Pro-64 3,4-dihydroxylase Tpa1-like proline 4-hydroxylase